MSCAAARPSAATCRTRSRETLEQIVARGRKIPSAGHSQGLRLVVVTDEDTRRAMAELALEPEYVATGLPPWISRAPAHVIVCIREEDYRARYREPDKTHGERRRSSHGPCPTGGSTPAQR